MGRDQTFDLWHAQYFFSFMDSFLLQFVDIDSLMDFLPDTRRRWCGCFRCWIFSRSLLRFLFCQLFSGVSTFTSNEKGPHRDAKKLIKSGTNKRTAHKHLDLCTHYAFSWKASYILFGVNTNAKKWRLTYQNKKGR